MIKSAATITPGQEHAKLLAIADVLQEALHRAEVTLPGGMLIVSRSDAMALRQAMAEWLLLFPVGKAPRAGNK